MPSEGLVPPTESNCPSCYGKPQGECPDCGLIDCGRHPDCLFQGGCLCKQMMFQRRRHA